MSHHSYSQLDQYWQSKKEFYPSKTMHGSARFTMAVLEFPPKESCRSRVNFELRYGICVDLPSTSAEITLPNVDNDKLIFVASFNVFPSAPDFD